MIHSTDGHTWPRHQPEKGKASVCLRVHIHRTGNQPSADLANEGLVWLLSCTPVTGQSSNTGGEASSLPAPSVLPVCLSLILARTQQTPGTR